MGDSVFLDEKQKIAVCPYCGKATAFERDDFGIIVRPIVPGCEHYYNIYATGLGSIQKAYFYSNKQLGRDV